MTKLITELTEEEKFIELKRIYIDRSKEELLPFIENEKIILLEIYNKFLQKITSLEYLREEIYVIMYSIFEEENLLLKIYNTTNYYQFMVEIANISSTYLEKNNKVFRKEVNIECEELSSQEEILIVENNTGSINNTMIANMIEGVITELVGEDRIIATLMLKDKLPSRKIEEHFGMSRTQCEKVYMQTVDRMKKKYNIEEEL